jgi:adenylate cyclase
LSQIIERIRQVAKISNLPVYEGPIPIDEVRSTHKRILKKVEEIRGQASIKNGETRRTGKTPVKKTAAAHGNTSSTSGQQREKRPVRKKNYDIYKEPIDIWDEFLSRHDDGPDGTHIEDAGESGEIEDAGESDEIEYAGESDEIEYAGESDEIEYAGESDEVEYAGESDEVEYAGESDEIEYAGESDEIEYAGESDEVEYAGESDEIDEPDFSEDLLPVVKSITIEPDMATLSGADTIKTPAETVSQPRKKTREKAKRNSAVTETDGGGEEVFSDEAPEPEKPTAKVSRKARIPIVVKLLTLVIAVLVAAFSIITTLVSILVSTDVRLTAEDNNFSINRRIADTLQTELHSIESAITMLFYNFETPKTADYSNNAENSRDSIARFFFEQNPRIAAIVSDGNYYINEIFFKDNGGDENLPRAWVAAEGDELNDAAHDTLLVRNASPFWRMPVLVMRVPLPTSSAEVFFDAEAFNVLLSGDGDNISYLLNEKGDALLHSDIEMLFAGANLRRISFVKNILDNSVSGVQNVYVGEDGEEYFAATRRLNVGSTILITIVQKKLIFDGVTRTTIRTIVFSAFILIAAIVFIVLFSRTISGPLHSLTNAAAKIEEGNYDLQLKVSGNDELAVLTQNFISMGRSLENFEKFTNKTIVRLAKGGKLSRGGTNRITTVCFAMIRDFSEMADGLDAISVVDFVNDYLRLMVPCITANGGCVDKFLTQGGMVIMAMWGAPETSGSSKEDALNCVRAALSMRAALCCLNQRRLRRLGSHIPLIKLGCGINTGKVIAGQIGSDERMEYTIIGDAVNLAARMEGPNDLFDTDILISEETYKYVGGYLITKEMRSIEVKGKEKPLRVFAVVNMRNPGIAKSMLEDLQKIPGTDSDICAGCIGPKGPRTLEEVRIRWGGGGMK